MVSSKRHLIFMTTPDILLGSSRRDLVGGILLREHQRKHMIGTAQLVAPSTNCGKSILQRKTQFNVRHLQMQQRSTNIVWPPLPSRRIRQVDSTNIILHFTAMRRFAVSPGHVTLHTFSEITWPPLHSFLRNTCLRDCRYTAFYDNWLLGWPIKSSSDRFTGSYHFHSSVNIFDWIEINLWNTSDALSLQNIFSKKLSVS
jgi:hypothetical protein